MKLEIAIQESLRAGLKKRGERIRAGSQQALTEKTNELKEAFRARVAAGLGVRAGNAVRSGFRKDPSKIAGLVYSAWRRPAAAGGSVPRDILAAYAQGTLVRPVRGKWIAYPADGSGLKKAPLNIDLWAASKGIELEFVPPGHGRSFAMLIERARTSTVSRKGVKRVRTRTRRGPGRVWFILIKSNRIPKKFDLDTPIRQVRQTLPDAIARNIGIERAD